MWVSTEDYMKARRFLGDPTAGVFMRALPMRFDPPTPEEAARQAEIRRVIGDPFKPFTGVYNPQTGLIEPQL